MNTCKKMSLVLALALGSATAANAAIVYSNLGEFGTFSSEQTLTKGWMASEFTPTQNSTLDKIILRLDGGDLGATVDPLHLTLQVYSDGGIQPGSLLYTLTTPSTDISFDQDVAFSFTPTLGHDGSLSSTQSYWARLSTISNDGISWVRADIPGARAYQRDGQSLVTSQNAGWMLEVQGASLTSVPVPGAVWLMGSALAGLVSFTRRKTS